MSKTNSNRGKRVSKVSSIKSLIQLVPRQIGDEIDLAKMELKDKAKLLIIASFFFVIALIIVCFMLTALIVAAIAGLGTVMPLWLSALIISGVFLLVAAIAALIGVKKLKTALPMSPVRALKGVAMDRGVLKEGSLYTEETYEQEQELKAAKKKAQKTVDEKKSDGFQADPPSAPLTEQELEQRIQTRRNHIKNLSDVLHGHGQMGASSAVQFAEEENATDKDVKEVTKGQKKLAKDQKKLQDTKDKAASREIALEENSRRFLAGSLNEDSSPSNHKTSEASEDSENRSGTNESSGSVTEAQSSSLPKASSETDTTFSSPSVVSNKARSSVADGSQRTSDISHGHLPLQDQTSGHVQESFIPSASSDPQENVRHVQYPVSHPTTQEIPPIENLADTQKMAPIQKVNSDSSDISSTFVDVIKVPDSVTETHNMSQNMSKDQQLSDDVESIEVKVANDDVIYLDNGFETDDEDSHKGETSLGQIMKERGPALGVMVAAGSAFAVIASKLAQHKK